jgi:hypothetical protein
VPPSPTVGAEGLAYALGGVPAAARAGGRSKTTESAPDAAAEGAAAAAAATAQDAARARRRRRAQKRDHGDEYAGMDIGVAPDWGADPGPATTASTRGAGSPGFAATGGKAARGAAGMATVAGDEYGSAPRVPMMPDTWEHEPG